MVGGLPGHADGQAPHAPWVRSTWCGWGRLLPRNTRSVLQRLCTGVRAGDVGVDRVEGMPVSPDRIIFPCCATLPMQLSRIRNSCVALGFLPPKLVSMPRWAHGLAPLGRGSTQMHPIPPRCVGKVPPPCIPKTPAEQRIFAFKVGYLGINGPTKLQKQKP